MRIAVDYRMSGSSGIGTYIRETFPFLLSLIKEQGGTVLLLGSASQLEPFRHDASITCAECNVTPFSLNELFSFPRLLCDAVNSCDVFYSPYCNVPSGIRVPIFTTIHDVVFLDVPGLASRLGTFIRKCCYRYAIYRSVAVFTVSEFSKDRIKETLQCKKEIIVTYNGIASYLAEPLNPPPCKTDTILFVGNIKKHKGLPTLLRSFMNACKNGLSANLLIVGNKDNFRSKDNSVFALIQECGDRVQFTDKVTNQQLQRLYAEARLVVQPSLYEGFGIPPLEALFMGTPVLISDIPVFKEIYGELPVAWFEQGNIDILSRKLNERYTVPVNFEVPERYSYKNVAQSVFKAIVQRLLNA